MSLEDEVKTAKKVTQPLLRKVCEIDKEFEELDLRVFVIHHLLDVLLTEGMSGDDAIDIAKEAIMIHAEEQANDAKAAIRFSMN